MADKVDEDMLLRGFLPDYAIERIYRKPYAACRHCHSAIEAALLLRQEMEDDRPFALLCPQIRVLPNLQAFKKVSPVFILVGEEAVERRHVQRFAKAARPGDQGYIVSAVPPFGYKICLIHIETLIDP